MKRFRRLGVFLHDSPADEEALEFAGRIAQAAQSESVLCVHVFESHDTPADAAPSADQLRALVTQTLPSAVAGITTVQMHKGRGVAEILRSARDLSLDLIIVGRRLPAEQIGIGAAFTRLARKAPCSVLLVPDHSYLHLARMLVPVDFSDHSRLALETAVVLAGGTGEARPQLVVQSVASVGYGYAKLGLSLREAVEQLAATTSAQLDKFVASVDTRGIELHKVCTVAEDSAAAIRELAAARKMDVIVIGSRGLTRAGAVLLGSVAERVVVASAQPVLVVKQKGETTHLLNALLGE